MSRSLEAILKTWVPLGLLTLLMEFAAASDFADRYILENFPSSNVTQLRATVARAWNIYATGWNTKTPSWTGLNLAYKVFCEDKTRRNGLAMEIFSKEFSCKMQEFWFSEGGTLREKTYENECVSKPAMVW